jgi:hypothetical protein
MGGSSRLIICTKAGWIISIGIPSWNRSCVTSWPPSEAAIQDNAINQSLEKLALDGRVKPGHGVEGSV